MRGTVLVLVGLLIGPVLLAGCLEAPPQAGTSEEGDGGEGAAAEPFTSAGAPPVAMRHTPAECGGPCIGHEAFVVFANGRAARITFDLSENTFAVVPDDGVRYSVNDLKFILLPFRNGVQPQDAHDKEYAFRVHSVETGALRSDAYWNLMDALLDNWQSPRAPTQEPYVDAVGAGDFVRWMSDGGTEGLMTDPAYTEDDPARHAPETVQFMGLVDAFQAAEDAFRPATNTTTDNDAGGDGPSEPAPGTVLAEAWDGRGEYWFTFQVGDDVHGVTVEGDRNPTLHLEAGTNVTVHFVNRGEQVHNLRFGGPVNTTTNLLKPGEFETLELGAPRGLDIAFEYWCDPHRALGMQGEVRVQDAPG